MPPNPDDRPVLPPPLMQSDLSQTTTTTPPTRQHTTEASTSTPRTHHTETVGDVSRKELGVPFPRQTHKDLLGSRDSPDSPSPLERPLSPFKPLPPPPTNLGTNAIQLLVKVLSQLS